MSDLASRLAKLPADRRAEILALLRDSDEPRVSAAPVRRIRGETGPVSFAQETLWFLQRLAPRHPTYNVPICFRLTGTLDVTAFRRAFADVVARHEMLRTSIAEGPDGPVQTVHPSVPVDVPLVDAPGADTESRRSAGAALVDELSRQPFAMEQAPVWRVALIRVAEDEHLFLFVIHHVIFDGWSLSVLCADLADRYGAWRGADAPAPAPANRLDYPDYALWQRDWLAGENLSSLIDYWRTTLAGAAVLEFPTDRPRPPVQSYDGALLRRRVKLADPAGIARLARALHTTPNTIYTATFFALLHRFTGQDDLVIGTPNANREYAEVESVIGYFINMLVLRADASGDPTFREFVARVNTLSREALTHGGLPFGKLVEAVRPVRDPSRSPLFQIAFVFQNTDGSFVLPEVVAERIHIDPAISRFDMSVNLYEHADGIEYNIEY
ncbi:MAG: condensation domain-containing protein, partial [Micromonosporaceae bacterium]